MELYSKVFGIELLREKILNFVVHDGERVTQCNALSCRLVQRAWLESVTRCLVKSGQPLFKFSVFKPTINQFLEVYTSSLCSIQRVPPYKLVVYFDSIQFEERRQTFEKCLRFCSSGLVDLELTFALKDTYFRNSDPVTFLPALHSLSLPVLQKLSVSLPFYREYTQNVNGNLESIFDINITPTVQSILFGCKRLTWFRLEGHSALAAALPRGFENLHLPATITNLQILRGMNTKRLEKLVMNNTFPFLTRLTISLPNVPHQNQNLVYRILDRARDTLKKLKIYGDDYSERENRVMIPIKLPVMTCLESIFIRARNCDWADGVANLHRKLPSIKKVEVRPVISNMLRKWTESSRFESVDEMSVHFSDYGELEVLTVELAQSLHQAFPNITRLHVFTTLLQEVDGALKFIFENMTQLKVLSIRSMQVAEDLDPHFLDSLLLGLPMLHMRDPAESCQDIWEAVQLSPNKLPSITNLTELRELILGFGLLSNYPIVVSDAVFEWTFLQRMPKLQKLKLSGMIKASPAMIQRWEQDGRSFL